MAILPSSSIRTAPTFLILLSSFRKATALNSSSVAKGRFIVNRSDAAEKLKGLIQKAVIL
jgi:hypothetical protein